MVTLKKICHWLAPRFAPPHPRRVQAPEHPEEVHVGDGEEREGQHERQTRQAVDVRLEPEMLLLMRPLRPKRVMTAVATAKGGETIGEQRDQVQQALAAEARAGPGRRP